MRPQTLPLPLKRAPTLAGTRYLWLYDAPPPPGILRWLAAEMGTGGLPIAGQMERDGPRGAPRAGRRGERPAGAPALRHGPED